MVTLEGVQEEHALLQVWGVPPNVPPQLQAPLQGLGAHAIVFTGTVDLLDQAAVDEVEEKKKDLDEGENSDIDDPFTWDLDIVVGPKWTRVRQVAPLVVVTDVFSSNTDEDNNFQVGVEFRFPRWSVKPTPGDRRIVLHVRIKQAGE